MPLRPSIAVEQNFFTPTDLAKIPNSRLDSLY